MGALLVKRVGCKTFHRIILYMWSDRPPLIHVPTPEKINENGDVSNLVQSELYKS